MRDRDHAQVGIIGRGHGLAAHDDFSPGAGRPCLRHRPDRGGERRVRATEGQLLTLEGLGRAGVGPDRVAAPGQRGGAARKVKIAPGPGGAENL